MQLVRIPDDATLLDIKSALLASYSPAFVRLSMDFSPERFLVKYHGEGTLVKVWLQVIESAVVVTSQQFADEQSHKTRIHSDSLDLPVTLALAHRFACHLCECLLFDGTKQYGKVQLRHEFFRLRAHLDCVRGDTPNARDYRDIDSSRAARALYSEFVVAPIEERMSELTQRAKQFS